MLPKRRKRPKMGVREPEKIECPSHTRWVRQCFTCLIADKHECWGRMESHHVRKGTHTGMSKKPSDFEVVPLCARAHEECHKGHDTFEWKYGVNLTKCADDLRKASPHWTKWLASKE